MRVLGIRSRLTIGGSIASAVALIIALGVASAQAESALESTAYALAQNDLVSFAADIASATGEGPDAAPAGLLIVIKDPSGKEVVDTAPHDVRLALPPAATTGERLEFRDDEGNSWVVAGRTVASSDGTWSLWAARDVSADRAAAESIDRVLALVGLGLLALLVAAFWLLARSALRPVESMRSHAEHLGDSELLPVGRGDDEITRLARTLNDMVERVRRGAEREQRMVSDAAHELRTPLASLRAELELARRHADDPDRLATGLDSAERSAERLAELATNLLELSRLDEQGAGSSTAASAAELRRAVLDAVDSGRSRAAHGDIDLDVTIDVERGEATYAIDPISYSRIVDNLLSNAVRAVGGSGHIVVALDDAGARLRLEVTDDGPGAPEDFLPHALERFTRAEVSRGSSGSGLGLALVAAIVHSAGGTVQLANTHPGFSVLVEIPSTS